MRFGMILANWKCGFIFFQMSSTKVDPLRNWSCHVVEFELLMEDILDWINLQILSIVLPSYLFSENISSLYSIYFLAVWIFSPTFVPIFNSMVNIIEADVSWAAYNICFLLILFIFCSTFGSIHFSKRKFQLNLFVESLFTRNIFQLRENWSMNGSSWVTLVK